jgi:hypothetical protein
MSVGINGTIAISRRTTYQVLFNATDLGLVDDVDPTKFKLVYKPIATGTTGKDNPVGQRLTGMGGMITVQFRQLSLAQYVVLTPWYSGTGFIPLSPPLNSDLYTYSKTLVLHPVDMLTVTTEDLVFSNACPTSPPMIKRTGGQEDVLEVEFILFPSRTTMGTTPSAITPGTIGQ